MSEFQETRKSRKKGKVKKKSRLGKKSKLKEDLDSLTNENVKLQKVVNIMEDEQKEAEVNERSLLQEIDSLKESIANLQMEKEQEENSLKTTIKMLKAELYDLGLSKHSTTTLESLNEESERDYYETPSYGRQWSSQSHEMKRNSNHIDAASVAGVPFYDRKMHKRSKNRRSRIRDGEDRVRRNSGARSVRGSNERTRGGVSNRRMSTPLPHRKNEEGIDAAARAFLDVFIMLKPKLLKSLWADTKELKMKNDELVMDTRHLPKLLHRLVVYAYHQDNPDKKAPSFRRTKPLITLLKLRLAPHLGSNKYISYEHFQHFPHWLEQREELGTMKPPKNFSSKNYANPAEEDVRSDLRAGSACLVWSDGGQRWCEGQVTSTKFDKEGEWLVVRYYSNSKSLEKEVQRYSDLIRVLAK